MIDSVMILKVDAAYVSLAGTICAAAIAALVAVALHLRSVSRTLRDQKREVCARAIADALAWLELPYRVRRRCDDKPETITALVNRMHDLHERLLFHESWLRVELPDTHETYCALVGAARDAVREDLRGAWESPPATAPAAMNLRAVSSPHLDAQVLAFSEQVRRRI